MTVTVKQIEQILKTLPIGFYVGKQIKCELNETAETSYFDPKKQSIVVSSKIILKGLENNNQLNENDIEQSVRSMLYHEVSHAILTPDYDSFPTFFNIFEDERIESILHDYYYNVDFKKQLLMISGKCLTELTKNANDYWFKLVRFRVGQPEHLQKVNELISRFASINSSLDASSYICSEYFNQVEQFYKSIVDDFAKNQPQLQDSQPLPNESTDLQLPHQDSNISINIDDIVNNAKQQIEQTVGKLPFTQEQLISSSIEQQLENEFDSAQFEQLKQIFELFTQKKGRFAGSSVGYSGRFNERLVTRNDYKFFTRQNDAGSLKNFSKVKLNLFIDCSGSYRDNKLATNRIISSLLILEQQKQDFSFDVISVGTTFKLKTKTDRYITTFGNSSLDSSIISVWKKVQDPNALNINVVLLDGLFNNGQYFKYLNYKNCCIISDGSNRYNIEKFAPLAKTTFLDKFNRNYSSSLFKTLCDSLTRQAMTI